MASPQLEDGFTRIANEVFEALAKIRIPGEARQVLDVVLRKTYGFHRKEDAISLSQFNLATGLVKPSIVRAINQLVEMNLISKNANGLITTYRFNKDYTSWKPLAKRLIVSKNANNHLQKSKKSLAKTLHTKDRKDTLNIYIPAFESFWNLYPSRNGRKVGKKAAFDQFKKINPDDHALLLQATRNYADSKQAKDGFAKDPERFLKSDFWRDWIDVAGSSAESIPAENLEPTVQQKIKNYLAQREAAQ